VHIVLDGANRVSALRELGVRDVLVQVVDYDAIALTSWYHLVAGIEPRALEDRIRAIEEVEIVATPLPTARAELEARSSVAIFIEPGGDVYTLRGGDSLEAQTRALTRIVATYRGQADIFRVQVDDMAALRDLYADIAGLVVFPPYTTDDIRRLAGASVKLPTGITRHVIPNRALRLNTDLELLWSEAPLPEKNRWLSEWTRHKLQSGGVRRYAEPTVLYDE
jgi:hypothetical protein